jgi:hypothetical protein
MSITSSNAVLQFYIPLVFPAPMQLQGFTADDVFGTDPLAEAEVQMGVDGRQSAGYVFVSTKQNYNLMADSPDNFVFDQWRAACKAAGEVISANAVILLKSIGMKYQMTNGVLTSYPPAPDGKRTLQGRRFEVTWEKIEPARS